MAFDAVDKMLKFDPVLSSALYHWAKLLRSILTFSLKSGSLQSYYFTFFLKGEGSSFCSAENL